MPRIDLNASAWKPICRRIALLAVLIFVVSTALSSQGELKESDSQTRTVELTNWIDRPFPLLDEIERSAELRQGAWLILLTDRGCPGCGLVTDAYYDLVSVIVGKGRNRELRFSTVSYGPGAGVNLEKESVGISIRQLEIPPLANLVPSTRSIVHIHDSKVVQVYAPTELRLVGKVFGGSN